MQTCCPGVFYYPNALCFFPIGNTSAKSFLRTVPQHIERVNFLLLGCGDLRNVLFTLSHLDSQSGQGPKRTLDFTMCDLDAGIHARNIILLVLATDAKFAKERAKSNYMQQLWCIFYYQFIDEDCYDLIQDCVAYILSFCHNWNSWRKSHIGKYIFMTSENAFIDTREIWRAYRDTEFDANEWERRRKALNCAFPSSVLMFRKISIRNTGIVLASYEEEIHMELWNKYYQDGHFFESNEENFTMVNPLFAISQINGTDFSVYPGTSPLFGYCLVSATREASNKPYAVDYKLGLAQRIVKVCQSQFNEWLLVAHDAIKKSQLVLHIYCGDALECCLQLSKPEDGCKDLLQWKFPSAKNSISPDTPKLFDVIDTSNLSDFTGLLNVLICAEPLLKNSPSSVLHTDMLAPIKIEKNRKLLVERNLGMNFETASVVLGLYLVEENFPFRASGYHIKEEIFKKMMESQYCIQLAWRRITHFDPSFSDLCNPNLSLSPLNVDQCVEFFTGVFVKLFEHLHSQRKLEDPYTEAVMYASRFRNYITCQGFVRLLFKYIFRVRVNASDFIMKIHEAIEKLEKDIHIVAILALEFLLWAHILGIGVFDNFIRDPETAAKKIVHATYNLPELVPIPKPYPNVSLLCLVIPRKVVDRYLSIPGCKAMYTRFDRLVEAPQLVVKISSIMTNMPSTFHILFGAVKKSGENHGDKAYIRCSHFDIVETNARNDPHAALVLFVPVVTFTLLDNPSEVRISLSNQRALTKESILEELGPEQQIYSTTLADTEHVSTVLDSFFPVHEQVPTVIIMRKDSDVMQAIECYFDANGVFLVEWTLNSENTSNLKTALKETKVDISQKSAFSLDLSLISTKMGGRTVLRRRIMVPFMFSINRVNVKVSKINCRVTVTVRPGCSASEIPLESYFPRFPRYQNFDESIVFFNNTLPSVSINACIALDVAKNCDWLSSVVELARRSEEYIEHTTKDYRKKSPVVAMNHIITEMILAFIERDNTDAQKSLFVCLGKEWLICVNGIYYETSLDTLVLNTYASIKINSDHSKMVSLTEAKMISMINIECTEEQLKTWHLLISSMIANNSGTLHNSKCEYNKQTQSKVNEKPLLYCQCALGENLSTVFCRKYSEICKHFYSVSIPLFFGNTYGPIEAVNSVNEKLMNLQISDEHCCMQCRKDESNNEKKKLLVCERCKAVKYCSKECQQKHWKIHKTVCCV